MLPSAAAAAADPKCYGINFTQDFDSSDSTLANEEMPGATCPPPHTARRRVILRSRGKGLPRGPLQHH